MNNKTKIIYQYVLGALVIIGFFALLITLVYTEIPIKNNDILNLVVGALIASFSNIIGYFFGSSSGSATKDETISTIAKSKVLPEAISIETIPSETIPPAP